MVLDLLTLLHTIFLPSPGTGGIIPLRSQRLGPDKIGSDILMDKDYILPWIYCYEKGREYKVHGYYPLDIIGVSVYTGSSKLLGLRNGPVLSSFWEF